MQQDASAASGDKLGLAGNLKLIEKLPPAADFPTADQSV